jgi:hypothetical protein
MEQETNLEEKIQNWVQREQEELAILLHARKIKAQRKENKRLGTLARARPKPVWEVPSIQGLGNQALVKGATSEPGTKQQEAPGDTGSVDTLSHSELSKSDPGFRIRKHMSHDKGFKLFASLPSEQTASSQNDAEAGSNLYLKTWTHQSGNGLSANDVVESLGTLFG